MQLNSAQQRGLAWFGLTLIIVGVVWLLGPVLTPFVVAAVLAYALAPMVSRLSRVQKPFKWPRVVSVAVVEIVFLLALLSVVLLIIPIIAKELPLLREQIPVLAERLGTWLSPFLGQFGIKVNLDVPSVKAFVLKYLSANAEEGLAQVMASLKIGGFLAEVDDVLGQYLRGQLLVMAILAVFYSLGLALFGLDLALPIGVFTGLAMAIPYVGFGIGLVLAILAGVLEFSATKTLVMAGVVFGAGQLIESLYLTPRFVGERIGLHPLAVIFALLAFGQLLGFVGVLIALPASAVLLVALRRAKSAYLGSKLFKG